MSFARDPERLVLALAHGARSSVSMCLVWSHVEWVGFTSPFWVRLYPSHVWLEGWSYPRFLFGSKAKGCGLRILACGPLPFSFSSFLPYLSSLPTRSRKRRRLLARYRSAQMTCSLLHPRHYGPEHHRRRSTMSSLPYTAWGDPPRPRHRSSARPCRRTPTAIASGTPPRPCPWSLKRRALAAQA